ncbi:MAG TPA: copper resistance protein CopC [Solirubrobacteraceae bacterium]|jgi:copper transport protein
MDPMLSRREVVLRSAAVAGLAGLALVQVIELPAGLAQGRHVAVLAGLLIGVCVVVARVLACGSGTSGGAGWRALAAVGALAVAGWAVTRAVAVPGLATATGDWTTAPGLAGAALGTACVALAAAGGGAQPSRTAALALVKAAALVAALAPGAGALLVALGPGPRGGESTISEASPAHVHAHAHAAPGAAAFRPGFGGHAGHYVYPNAVAPHLPAWALALAVGAAALLTYLAIAALRGRAAPPAVAGARRAVPRALATTLIALIVLAAVASTASAHATLLRSAPRAATHVARAPAQVRLAFSEPVQIVRPSDVSVVDGRGRVVSAGPPRTGPADDRVVTIALRARLLPDSYTVRYRVISADSHGVDDALVFALGEGRLRAPVLRGAGGLSETAPWAVAARFAELIALGLLLGLLAFRSLVWGPAVDGGGRLRPAERAAARAGGSRLFWRAFWAVAGAAGLAEAGVLAAKSAVVFHTDLVTSLTDPAAAYRLAAASRFGDLLGWRSGLLVAVVAVAFWEWARETSGERPRHAAGRAVPSGLIGALSIATLTMLAIQGHASQAPLAPLAVVADAVHLAAAAVWIGGLPCLAAVLIRAPAALPDGGRRLARLVLARFSRIALAAVALIVVTGLLRAAGELASIADLWSTGYGRSLAAKALLMCPVAFLAMRNRRAAGSADAAGAALNAVRRRVRAELAIGLNIVVIAALLVAQVPGRDAPARGRAKAPAAQAAPSTAQLAGSR